MSDILTAPASKKQPAVVDFSEGHYKFGYSGKAIRTALYEKIKKMEEAYVDLLRTLTRELGEDMKEVAALMVALHEENTSVKARYIKSICSRSVELGKEISELKRIANGMHPEMIYTLGVAELERFGL